jgi:hypothetical protein
MIVQVGIAYDIAVSGEVDEEKAKEAALKLAEQFEFGIPYEEWQKKHRFYEKQADSILLPVGDDQSWIIRVISRWPVEVED